MTDKNETTIVGEVLKYFELMHSDPDGAGGVAAKDLQEKAIKAVMGGLNSGAWREYMDLFATSERQLDRLCGEDPSYIQNEYAEQCLAYMVANGTCGIDTRRNGDWGTLNFVPTEAIAALDRW